MSVSFRFLILAALLCSTPLAAAGSEVPGGAAPSEGPVKSEVVEAGSGELVLVQTVVLDAPVERVWDAYTTEAGYRAWAAPLAEIDLRAGGTLRAHYDPAASLGDPGTITIHIVNLVPQRVLTLRADVADNWPEIMKQDAGRLMNIVLFESLPDGRTRVESYGVGYRDVPEYRELLGFFITANEKVMADLKRYVEAPR